MKAHRCPACKNTYTPVYREQVCPHCSVVIEDNEPLYVPASPRLPVEYDRSIRRQEIVKRPKRPYRSTTRKQLILKWRYQ